MWVPLPPFRNVLDPFTAHRLFAAFDRRMAALAALARARRRMKMTLASLGVGVSLVILETFGLVVLASADQRPPLVEYWGPLSAVGVALVAFATLRATVVAHKEHTAARLSAMASKAELDGVVAAVEELHKDVREVRGMVSRLLERGSA